MRTKLALIFLAMLAGSSAQLRGVDYGIQKPDGSCTAYEDVLADFQIIATFAQAVKIYNMGYCLGAQNTIQAGLATGLKVFLGMQAAPDSDYQNEKSVLQSVLQQFGSSNILGITVGSEDLYRNAISSDTLASQITEVKGIVAQLGFNVPVTHTDVYYLQPQNILDAEDIVMFNAFPFWEGVDVNDALSDMISHYNQVVNEAGGKTVWIGETGWPEYGQTQANAVPSAQNMQQYLNAFVCWANANGVPYFWFEAFDEPWKGQPEEIETSFGLYDSNRNRKPSFVVSCNTPGGVVTPSTSSTPAATTGNANPTPSNSNSAQCGGGLQACGQACYLPSQYCCPNGQLTQISFCSQDTGASNSPSTSSASPAPTTATPTSATPTSASPAPTTSASPAPSTADSNNAQCGGGLQACGQACYLPSQYCCPNGQLTQIAFCSQDTGANSPAPTTSAASPAPSTSNASPAPSTSAAPTTSAASPAPTTSAASNGGPVPCGGGYCGTGAQCCAGGCYSPNSYSCPSDPFTGQQTLCPVGSSVCNGACYSPSQYSCSSSGLQQAR